MCSTYSAVAPAKHGNDKSKTQGHCSSLPQRTFCVFEKFAVVAHRIVNIFERKHPGPERKNNKWSGDIEKRNKAENK